MNSALLMDFNRLVVLDLQYCGVEMENGAPVWVCDPEARYKFIVLTDNTLVIGPIGDHKELYAVYKIWDQPIEGVRGRISDIRQEAGNLSPKPIIGAGEISANGRITGWKSGGFDISTPESMRSEVRSEVTRLFQDGLLKL